MCLCVCIFIYLFACMSPLIDYMPIVIVANMLWAKELILVHMHAKILLQWQTAQVNKHVLFHFADTAVITILFLWGSGAFHWEMFFRFCRGLFEKTIIAHRQNNKTQPKPNKFKITSPFFCVQMCVTRGARIAFIRMCICTPFCYYY